MQYGFLMDHRRCIGCHACTVACKAENDVPVGSFRTWVKYTEVGRFPSVRRHFAILRCNHCTKAPCVTICPVNALEKRPQDGIVDIDRDACIGCRACMQACPYDAIYLNEDSGAVEKCHYCAHRVERGLEPACVVVCPEQAIVAGDLHDPTSKIARMVAEHDTLVRRPEQGTGPNVHYVDVAPVSLQPGRAERPATYLWSEVPPTKPEPWPEGLELTPDARTVLDAGHKVQWGWPVALYLVTKGLGAGAAILAPFLAGFGVAGFAERWLPELLALLFTGITTFLLVEDLHRPLKFLTLLTRPNTKSWLVRGAWILMAFSGVTSAILAARWFGMDALADGLRWLNVPLGLGAAGYTAWLFGQCEGRDLWQSKLLLPHLLAQAVLCGAAALLAAAPRVGWGESAGTDALAIALLAASAVHALLGLLEAYGKHPTDNSTQAAAFLTHVRFAGLPAFHVGLVLGVLLTVALALTLPGLAWIPALLGLYVYKWAYVRAAQLPPLS
jgi:Fe-S-cluster-containing dehydrogenase component/formate-dependent nitrite reductase membrane component NrfD